MSLKEKSDQNISNRLRGEAVNQTPTSISTISESINKSISNRGSIHFNALINCTTSLNLSSKPETYCSLHF